MAEHGYRNALPLNSPMLTSDHKQKRIEWAKKHINDNWNKTLKDKTSLFCFRQIMDAKYYTEILEMHLPEVRSILKGKW